MLRTIDRRAGCLRFVAWYRTWPAFYRWIPPVAWMVLIFFVSAQPTLPHAPDALWDTLLKKLAHMIEYAILFVLLRQARGLSSVRLAWGLTVLYAVSDEFHQTFVPGRNGWYGDVIVDGLGALLAALVARVSTRRRV